MSASRLKIRHPQNHLKRYFYVQGEFKTFLEESHIEEILSDIWIITALSNEEDIINSLFGRGNADIIENRDLYGWEQTKRNRPEDAGYWSFDSNVQTNEKPLTPKFRPEDLLICVLTPIKGDTAFTLSGKEMQLVTQLQRQLPAFTVENNLLLFVDNCTFEGHVETDAVYQYFKGADPQFASPERLIKTTLTACLKSITEKMESKLIDKMQIVQKRISEKAFETEQGVFDLHNGSNIKDLDRLIDICKRPTLPIEVPEELRHFLTSTILTGIKGFGVHHNKFMIFVQPGANKSDKDKAFNEASKHYGKESIEIHENDNPEFCIPHSYGCGGRLIRRNGQAGSVAFCCKMETKDGVMKTVIVTSSHVLNENEPVYMDIADTRVEVGKCIYSPNEGAQNTPSLVDIAVVQINENNENNFHTKILDRNTEMQDFRIYEGTCDQYTPVWKHGASTNLTTGVVTCPEFTIFIQGNTRLVTIIEGNADQVFSEPGDSGASVLVHENEEILGLSVIVGDGSLDKHPPAKSSKKKCLTARLNSAIKRFETEYDAKLHFGIQSP